ncbi:MAG: efflux RND transporter permease subunit, partial [bacterium]|nr:efflux RND transporter permease subunit [bacterium]
MQITNYCIRHRTTIMILIVLITVAGLMSYVTLPRESAPDIKIPLILVMTTYEGASPSDVESLITRPLERKLKSLADVKEMQSNSAEGISMIDLEFEPDYDIDSALQKVRDKVDQAKSDLPEDLENDPTVGELSASDLFPVMYVMISGDVGLVRLKKIAEDIQEEIEGVRGVLAAEIQGGLEREIRVEFSQDRISAYHLTLGEIIQTVTRNNVNIPGGSLEIGESRYNIKAPAEFDTPDEIDHLVVATREGRPIYLRDVAAIRDTFKDRNSFSRLDGRESVGIRITKRSGENLLAIAGQIKRILDDWRQRLPRQVRITVTSDSSKDIGMMVSDLENNIWTGLILVLAVIFVSLGFRNAVMVALAIPFSMLITFFVVQIFGMTLNMIVLFSLILALGMLVDNAIVIVENIYRHHVREGRPVVEASMTGTSEVAWPVISSTLTTVVAFVPLIFWPGAMGEFMGYLPKTVIIALLASLLVGLVINPTLCAMFLRPSKRDRLKTPEELDAPGFIIRAYCVLLEMGLRYRLLSVLFFLAVLVAGIDAFINSGLGVEMFPDTEPNRIVVSIEAPEGTNVYQTNEFTARAEQIVAKYGNIQHVTTTVGGGSGGVNTARITVDMVDRDLRRASGTDGRIYFVNSNDTMSAMRRELTGAIV